MAERKWWHVSIGFFIAILPVYIFFGIGFSLLPVNQWIFGILLVGIVTLTLAGCSIGGGYDSGCIWHYHGAPEHIVRPDIERLQSE